MKRLYDFSYRDGEGFTLLEILLALAISVMILQVAYTLLFTGYTSFKRISEAVDVQQNVRLAMGHIIKMLHASSSTDVIVDETADQLTANGSLFYKSQHSLYEKREGISNEIAYNIDDFIVDREDMNIYITIKGNDGQGHIFLLTSQYTLRR